MTYNLNTCTDIDTLNSVYQKLIEPFQSKFEEQIEPIEAKYFEECKPFLEVFDDETREVHTAASAQWKTQEDTYRAKMESIRKEALRRIKVIEGKMHKTQEKFQQMYYNDPIVSNAQSRLKASTAVFDAKRDEEILPFHNELLETIRPIQEEYHEVLRSLEGSTKIRRIDK